MGWIYSKAAHRAVPAAGELVGLIQIGTGYSLPGGHPVATYEDMTVRWSSLDLGYPEWRALTKRQIANRLNSQRRAYEAADVCCFTTWWAAQSAIDDCAVPVEKVRVVGVGRETTPSMRRLSGIASFRGFLSWAGTGSGRTAALYCGHSPGCGRDTAGQPLTSSAGIRASPSARGDRSRDPQA